MENQHSIESKLKISIAKSKIRLGLFDLENNLINTFPNQVMLAKFLNLNKSTIGRYYKSGNILLGKYIIREIKQD